ncbi:MAG TPA: hypothetical protein VGM05_08465 [Planctomycetaceae bacterium]
MNVKCQFVAVCLSLGLATSAVAASKLPIKKLTQDPKIPPVELFDAIEQGLVETTVIAKNSHEANVFVTNKSAATVSIQFPKAVAAVQVLKQLGFGQPPNGRGNGGVGNNGPGGAQSQPVAGGQVGANGNQNGPGANMNTIGNGFPNGNGNGVFSVPPQKTVQVPLMTVCLAHGKPEPRARQKYQLVKLETYSSDPVLHETIQLFVSGATDAETAQAAVWHLTDKMSWDDLHAKQIDRLSLDPVPYFGEGKVDAAKELIQQAQDKVKETPRKVETASRRRE